MRILLISDDEQLKRGIDSFKEAASFQITMDNSSHDPLDVMSLVCQTNPTILIADDDFLKPNSARILRSIKKVKQNIGIIFLTSDTSLGLGRDISQIGIQYYGIKPIVPNFLIDSIESILQMKMKTLY